MRDQSTGGEGGGRNKPPDIPARCRKQERNRRVPEAGRSQYPVRAMGSMTNLSADGARERGPSRRISRLSVGNRNGIRGSPRDAANTHRPDDGEPMTAPSSDGAGERWRRAGGYPQAMPGPGTEPPRPRTAAQCWRKRLNRTKRRRSRQPRDGGDRHDRHRRRRTPGRRVTDRRRSAQRALRRDEQRRRATQRVRQPAKSRGRGRGKPSTMSRISGANEAAMPRDAQRYAVKWRRKATNGKRPRKPDDNAAGQQQPRNTISRQ